MDVINLLSLVWTNEIKKRFKIKNKITILI